MGITIVSYKHNVVAKHGSSKLLTTNEMLLELRIKSMRILASIMGYVQIVYWLIFLSSWCCEYSEEEKNGWVEWVNVKSMK